MVKEYNKKNESLKESPRVGLVLSGGAARGLAHLGVISVLEEYKIPVDYIVAASFGSIVGGYYAYGYSIPELLKMTKKFRISRVMDLKKPWLQILNREKIESIFTKDLGAVKIEDLKIPLFILTIDINNGELFVFERGLLSTAICASSSFPGLLTPYRYDDHLLIDGGILNRFLGDIAIQRGADIIISSDVCIFSLLNRSKSARKILQLLLAHVSKKRKKQGIKLKKMTLRHILFKTLCIVQDFQNQKKLFTESSPDFIIEPVGKEIKPLRFRKVEDGYKLGREAALKVINDIVSRVYRA